MCFDLKNLCWFSASRLISRLVNRVRWTSAPDRNPWYTRPRTDTSWWWDEYCYDEECAYCTARKMNLHTKRYNTNWDVCRCRLPLGLGHGNMCGVEKTHKKHLHISSGDPEGERNVSTGNSPDQKQLHFCNPELGTYRPSSADMFIEVKETLDELVFSSVHTSQTWILLFHHRILNSY